MNIFDVLEPKEFDKISYKSNSQKFYSKIN